MHILSAAKMQGTNSAQYAWASLRRFHNVGYTSGRISDIHKISKRDKRNAGKQADQIRFFLMQAKEYFDASKSVTLVTRPVLLYYCAMCLATSEVLFKQSGDISLDRARDRHRHHGLEFVNKHPKRTVDKITESAAGLRAKPALRPKAGAPASKERYGTFELWQESAREAPLPADIEQRQGLASTTSYGAILTSADSRLGFLPVAGLTLLEIVAHIPGMARLLSQMGVEPRIIRAHTHLLVTEGQTQTRVTIHPGEEALIDEFLDNVLVNPNDVDGVTYNEFPSGGQIIATTTADRSVLRLIFPPCTCEEYPHICFWPTRQSLNEFGFLYVALYIVGNYARYYPDFWIHDVERCTELGLMVEELLSVAERRLALLTLSELTQTLFVPAA